MDFQINTDDVKIASKIEKISQTIEGLLALNDRIPAHKDSEVMDITEKQLDSSDYEGKKVRGEEEGITEFQLDESDIHEGSVESVQQVQIEEANPSDGGHRPETWDKDDEEVRGHKSVSPLWHQVYKQEDERKNKSMKKSL